MILHRVRAHIRFPTSSGMATWARDNMAVRYQQAIHIRQGESAEEEPVNEVVDDGDRQVFRCDLPLMDEAHAIDAFATLSDANVLGQSQPHPDEDSSFASWVDRHQCDHDEDVRAGCVVMARSEGPT